MKKLLTVFALSSMVVACGGTSSGDDVRDGSNGGSAGSTYSGNTSAAEISADNKRALAESATYGAMQAKSGSQVPNLGGASAQSATQYSNELVLRTEQSTREASSTDNPYASFCTAGGSASYSGDSNGGTLVFSNCNLGHGVVVNGKTIISHNSDGSQYSFKYENYTVSVDGYTTTLNMTMSCTTDSSGFPNCNTISDFKAANGQSYRVENASVSGNSSSGYNISATVYDSTYGSVSVTSTNLVLDCSNGLPSSGSITYTSGSELATVTFNSCSEYTVTLDGTADTYNW